MAPVLTSPHTGAADEGAAIVEQAQLLLAGGRIADSQQLLLELLQGDAQLPAKLRAAAHRLLAIAAVLSQQPDPALQHAVQGVQLEPDSAQQHLVLGRACKLAGRLDHAVAAYRRAIELDPWQAEAHVSLGIALKHGGDLPSAIACYERALQLNPQLAAARANLAYARGALISRQAEHGADAPPPDEVLAEARNAAELDPHNPALLFNLGLLMRGASRRSDAIDAFNRALGLAPNDLRCCLHLGHELTADGQTLSALALYQRWLELNPPAPAVMRALANLQAREGLPGAALQWAERAAALDPDPKGWLQLCHSRQQCRQLVAALDAGRRAIELSGGHWEMHSVPLMVANYQLEDAQALATLHAHFGRSLAADVQAAAAALPPAAAGAAADGRLRIGYVSADLINHSVAFFFGHLLEHHDRGRFEVWCYHGRGHGDGMTEHLRGLGHHWVDTDAMSDEALARRIRADGIGVLVDLSGHTSGARLRVFGMGAAPAQVSYLGYPTHSGVQRIAHRISDHTIDPGDMPDIGCEKPLPLPRSMFCWRAPESPAIGPPPSMQRGHVTFGSFNNHAKISDRCLALWARVLQAVPRSRLLLKSASVADAVNRAELEAFMAQRGIGAERLDLRSRVADRCEHFETYNQIDIALDPFPYNGATTTCEALWMGLPVVTLAGSTHAGRMGASILQAAGRRCWVAHDEDRYVALAAGLAVDSDGRQAWREEARNQLARSELTDETGFARCFEAALEIAWSERAAVPSPV